MITAYEIDQAVQQAIARQLPIVLERVLEIKSAIDTLPDYPSQKQAAEAIGISTSKITKMLDSGILQRHYIGGLKLGRLSKSEIKGILIKSRI